MKSLQAKTHGLVIALVVALLLFGVSPVSFADVRIVMDSEGELDELLVKAGRVRSELGNEQWMLIDCASDQLTIVGSGRYWQGSLSDFTAATVALAQEALSEVSADVDVMGLLGQLFGGSAEPDSLEVRVTRLGTETIAGYAATEYHIETGSGANWKTYENVWVSTALLELLQGEVGQCVHLLIDFQESMMEVLPFLPDNLRAVMEDEAYRALQMEGYPVRTITQVEFFGMNIETVSEVVEVSRDPIPEDHFTVPAGYARVDNPMEIVMDL